MYQYGKPFLHRSIKNRQRAPYVSAYYAIHSARMVQKYPYLSVMIIYNTHIIIIRFFTPGRHGNNQKSGGTIAVWSFRFFVLPQEQAQRTNRTANEYTRGGKMHRIQLPTVTPPMGEGPTGDSAEPVGEPQENDMPGPNETGDPSNATSQLPHYCGDSHPHMLAAYAILCVVLLVVGIALCLISVRDKNWDTARAGIPFLILFFILAALYWSCHEEDPMQEQPQVNVMTMSYNTEGPSEEDCAVNRLHIELGTERDHSAPLPTERPEGTTTPTGDDDHFLDLC